MRGNHFAQLVGRGGPGPKRSRTAVQGCRTAFIIAWVSRTSSLTHICTLPGEGIDSKLMPAYRSPGHIFIHTFISAFSMSHSFLSRSNRRHSDCKNCSTLGKAYSATAGPCGPKDWNWCMSTKERPFGRVNSKKDCCVLKARQKVMCRYGADASAMLPRIGMVGSE